MMKDTDVIIAFVFGFGGFIFLVILVLLIRSLVIGSFHRKCRALGLRPSPRDSYFCIGNWQDARVAVERCGTKHCNSIYIYMDLGELPPEATHDLGYFMQGLQRDYFTLAGYKENRDFNKVVAGSWREPYLYAHLRLNATSHDIRQLCEVLYQIRNELRRRIFSARR